MEPIEETVKEIKWNVLEQFSKVARYTRNTATTLLENPLARPLLPHLSSGIVPAESTRSVVDEYDSGRLYLAKWAAIVAEQAEVSAISEHPNQSREELYMNNWKKRWSDSDPRSWEEETEVGAFEILSNEATLPPLHATRSNPLNAERWFSFFDTEGRLKVELSEVQEAVFRGGVEDDIRVEVWKFFLGIYSWDSSQIERESMLEAKAHQYWALKREWWDSAEVQADETFREQKTRIEKDVIRTDRSISFFAVEDMPHPDPLSSASSTFTNKNLELMKDILMTYNFYNKDLGYVQGMSDLLAPLFVVMRNEVTAFWAFVGFMNRMKSNFYRDQSGMRKQLLTLNHLIQFMDPQLYKHLQKTDSLNLFFCFRWILVWFKREFKWDEVLFLWEVLWSDYLSSQFHLFVALAILDKHRMVIMENLQQFDEILKYVNDLSTTITLDETLLRAETLFHQFQRMVSVVDKKRFEVTTENSSESVRRRKGKESETNGSNNAGDSSSSSNMKLPAIHDFLRDLLKKEPPQD
ncbi:7948_t:CDS:10 [Funneliformis geosporum]|nr:7948_t:CDS:10 [Funneliformis geosporum]